MMTFVKFITFLWPFLREMVLGGKTVKEALRHHFARVVLTGMILLSVALNFFTVPRLLSITYEYVELKRKYDRLNVTLPRAAESPVAPPAVPETPAEGDTYRQTKDFFDRLREKELHH